MKSVLKTALVFIIALGFCMACLACIASGNGQNKVENTNEIRGIYNMYVAYAESVDSVPLSYEAWLESIRGAQGERGADGLQGLDGNGIDTIFKSNTIGNVDEYVIRFTNGQEFTFEVTNGQDGEDGVAPSISINEDGYWVINGIVSNTKAVGQDGKSVELRYNAADEQIEWKQTSDEVWQYLVSLHSVDEGIVMVKDGKDGKDGKTVELRYVEEAQTLEWKYTDESEWEQLVSLREILAQAQHTDGGNEGESGQTPYIGNNGNWWIGDTDTGAVADYGKGSGAFSDGLRFVPATEDGKAGLVVASYSGEDTDVVIPNRVGAMEVIGIDKSAFGSNTKITSVVFSKNTVYLAKAAFEGCSALQHVDFNDCELTYIPEKAFNGLSALARIDNFPRSVANIGADAFHGAQFAVFDMPDGCATVEDSAFYNVPLRQVDLSHVRYFGANSFNGYVGNVYLSKDVTFVGSGAFAKTWVYLEIESKPNSWGSNISFVNDRYLALQCRKSQDYIYSVVDNQACVYAYLGNSDILDVPTAIDGATVRRVGYGFVSYPCTYYRHFVYRSIESALFYPKIAYLPDTLLGIDAYSFNNTDVFVTVPSSVEICSLYSGLSSFFAFATDSLPAVCEGYIDGSDPANLTSADLRDDSSLRFALNAGVQELEYDEEMRTFYKKDVFGYTLLAMTGDAAADVVIRASFNDLPVHTIGADVLPEVSIDSIKIESGIVKIQGFAFDCSAKVVAIPKTVQSINAYGFFGKVDQFYIAAGEKPEDWDTYWSGSNTSAKIVYGVNDVREAYGFVYNVTTAGNVELLQYLLHSDLYIPDTLAGYPVTTIRSGFYSANYMKVYIPSSITKIEGKAFVLNTSNYSDFYIEHNEAPSGWAANWHYTSSSASYYIRDHWGQTFEQIEYSDDFAYIEKADGTVKLISYVGDSTTIVIPQSIAGKVVNELGAYCICAKNSVDVYIHQMVKSLVQYTIYLDGTSVYGNVYYAGSSLTLATKYCVNGNGYDCGKITYNVEQPQ